MFFIIKYGEFMISHNRIKSIDELKYSTDFYGYIYWMNEVSMKNDDINER